MWEIIVRKTTCASNTLALRNDLCLLIVVTVCFGTCPSLQSLSTSSFIGLEELVALLSTREACTLKAFILFQLTLGSVFACLLHGVDLPMRFLLPLESLLVLLDMNILVRLVQVHSLMPLPNSL